MPSLKHIAFVACAACIAVLARPPAGWAAEAFARNDAAAPSVVVKGKGSYYADRLHGQPTASGELLDQDDLTAASRDLPLGAHATVTTLSTGKSVRVRINDRGPYVRGRVIDLSKRAAELIDIDRGDGVAQVQVEAVPSEQPTAELEEKVAQTAIKKRAAAASRAQKSQLQKPRQ